MKRKFIISFFVTALTVVFSACNMNAPEKLYTDTTPPAPVTEVSSEAGDGKVLLKWSDPADEDFYGVEITAAPAAGTLQNPVVVKKNVKSFLVTGLTNGTEYIFSLKSIDNSTNAAEAVTTTAKPVAPFVPPVVVPNATQLAVSSTVSKKVTLTWTKPDGDFYCYNLYVTAGTNTESYIIDNSATTYTVGGLTNGVEYTFVLKVVDSALNLSSGTEVKGTPSKPIDYIAPLISESRTESLDYIFNPDVLGETQITISREEWNKMLGYYDLNKKNETDVLAAQYTFKKGEYEWNIQNVGFRIRGNTSRVRPQEGGKYRQAHFKVSFEEFLPEGEEAKLSKCMKGVVLKRFNNDSNYAREIFGYNLFRSKGIWTAPRASYTRLSIKIVEDDSTEEVIDYGVYIMLESTDKQYVKARAETINENHYESDSGNLWKCTWQNDSGPSLYYNYKNSHFGVEHIELDDNYSVRYNYDLKTNKENINQATADFKRWIKELNSLTGEDSIKAWYESHMDIDLFLKTYAVNVALGMDDDYWSNKNNYYMYFDSSKAYFIPYDYDNILGTNCFSDTATRNPLKWGEEKYDVPLINKALSVPVYMDKYKEYLREFTSEEYISESISQITRWEEMVTPYVNSSDLEYSTGTTAAIEDHVGTWCSNYKSGVNYKLLTGTEYDNFFRAKASAIYRVLNSKTIKVTYDFNGGTVWIDDAPKNSVTLEVNNADNLKDAFDSWLSGKWMNYTDDKHTLKSWVNANGIETRFSSDDITLTAVWIEDDLTYVPYRFNEATKDVTFTFAPELYDLNNQDLTQDMSNYISGINHSVSQIEYVYIAHSDENDGDWWGDIATSGSPNYRCVKDGSVFTVTTSISSWGWYGYQFIICYNIDGEKYYQWMKWECMKSPYKESISEHHVQYTGDKNFLITDSDFYSAKYGY